MSQRYRDTSGHGIICGILLTSGLAALAIVLVLFTTWYCVLVSPNKLLMEKRVVYIADTLFQKQNAIQKGDSIVIAKQLAETATLTDSLKNVVERLDNQYHDDVDLMINKANGWIAFWIGIFGVIVGVVAIWQLFRQYKYEKLFKDLENENEQKMRKWVEEYTNNAMDLHRRQEMILESFGHKISAYNDEIIMSSVMMCVSITDPLASPDSLEWKKQVYYFLNKLLHSYSAYLKCLEKSTDEEKFCKISLILVCIKLALVRALPVFPSYEQNVSFFILKKKIEEVLEKLYVDHFTPEQLLASLHVVENEFSKMLSVVSFTSNPSLAKVENFTVTKRAKADKIEETSSKSTGDEQESLPNAKRNTDTCPRVKNG